MIASQNSAFAGFLPADAAHEIWGNGGIVAGVARANGRAVAHGDSYTAGGRWPFASGSSHADWFVGECIVENEDGTPQEIRRRLMKEKALFIPSLYLILSP